MAGNSFGTLYKLTSFGESHGEALGGIIEGCPAGIELDFEAIQAEMTRRKPGQSSIVTQRKEDDEVKFLSGIFEGKTTGKYATRDKSMNQIKKENEAVMKAEKTFQSKLKNEKNIKEGVDAFKQLDGRLNFKKGGKARSLYNKGGYAKGGQPMYGHGECPKAKAN